MGVFAYKGIGPTGRAIKGVRDADNQKALRLILKREGVLVTEVLDEASAEKKRAGEVDLGKLFRRVSVTDVAISTRQLSTLLRSGIPLVEALSALIDQLEQPELRGALTQIRDRVNEGTSFADALKAHPKMFNHLYVSMVAAGEASGTLDSVLNRLAEFLEAQAKLQGKVLAAVAYPAMMGLLSVGVIAIMMIAVVPKVTAIFDDFGAALPWYTQLLIFVSHSISDYWWLIGGVLGAAIYSFRRWKATEDGTKKWDLFVLRIPVLGQLIVMIAVTRFARTLSTLLKSGVPVLRAMEITRNVLGNTELARVVEEARSSIREGESIAVPLRKSRRFPPIVTHMIAIGERSGQLEEMLEHVARAYDDQVENRMTALTSLLQPLLIIVMGGTAGGIVFSIMMPLLQINEFVG